MLRRARFRLTTALVVMGVLAILAAWYADHARLAEEIDRLEREIAVWNTKVFVAF